MSADHARVRSDIGPYALTPLWLAQTDASNFAIRLFIVLAAKYADRTTGACFPFRQTLADDLGVTISTIDSGLAELQRVGAVTLSKQSHGAMKPLSNVYTLVFSQPAATNTEKSVVVRKRSENATTSEKSVAVPRLKNQSSPRLKNQSHRSKGSTQNQVNQSTPLTPRAAGGTAAPRKLTRADRKAAQAALRAKLRAKRQAQLLREDQDGRQRLEEARVAIAALPIVVRDRLWTLAVNEYELRPHERDYATKAALGMATLLVERARGRTIERAVAEFTAAVTRAA